jgi:hypothetical protein
MKLKNKIALTLLCASLLAAGTAGLTACGNTTDTQTETLESVYSTYVANAESSGSTALSYSEWLKEIKGETGAKGDSGANGSTPYIGENGNWYIDDTDTGVSASGDDGEQGEAGKDGKDGVTISEFKVLSDGSFFVKYSDGTTATYKPAN